MRKINQNDQAKAVSTAVAKVKLSSQKSFSLKELGNLLRGQGCPYAISIPTILKEKSLICQRLDSKYEFSSPNQIHYEYFKPGLEVIRRQKAATNQIYQQKWVDKKAKSDVIEKPKQMVVSVSYKESTKSEYTIQDMIDYLKDKGYRILKPVTSFEEV